MSRRHERRGRGIVFLTPHLGCFEVTAQYYANAGAGAPLTVLYRPPRKAWLAPLVERRRARGNLKLAPADLTGVRRLLRALKRGEAIGMLPDQVPSNGEGVWARFFGKPAYTMTLPARLVRSTGATVLLASGERLADGAGWVVHFSSVDEGLDDEAGARGRATQCGARAADPREPGAVSVGLQPLQVAAVGAADVADVADADGSEGLTVDARGSRGGFRSEP